MKKCDLKLKELIETTILADVEDSLDDIFEDIAKNKNATDSQNEEIKELHEFRDELNEILKDIKNRELDKQECAEIFEALTEMIEDEEED